LTSASDPIDKRTSVHTRHKVFAALAVLVAAVAWLAWTMLTVQSDLGPGG